ncbi:MAG: adenylate/guanylate cyclase domain-containing protein, partial [Halobacteriales archaeon]|nr:adenylate/guanylate cyclase domain-containing protein [Halobacteriales archaeon]
MNTDANRAVTFLFTDVVGSSRLWDTSPDAMRSAMVAHDEMTYRAVTEASGQVVKHTGDGVFATFLAPADAVTAAREIRDVFAAHDWSPIRSFAVRAGIHTGTADQRDGDWFGPEVSRAARIMAHAGPGEVLVSESTGGLIESSPNDETLVDLGLRRLRGFTQPVRVFRLGSGSIGRASPGVAATRQATWVAVLPFRAIGDVDRDGWLAEAITDDLIALFGSWRSMRVIGRASSFRYRDTELTATGVAT